MENRLPKKFEEVEVDLLRVRIFFLVDAHKQVLNVDNDAQQPVKFGVVDGLKDEHIVKKVFLKNDEYIVKQGLDWFHVCGQICGDIGDRLSLRPKKPTKDCLS